MDKNICISEICLKSDNIKTLLEILENINDELEDKTICSEDREIILKSINQFNAIINALSNENKMLSEKSGILQKTLLQEEKQERIATR